MTNMKFPKDQLTVWLSKTGMIKTVKESMSNLRWCQKELTRLNVGSPYKHYIVEKDKDCAIFRKLKGEKNDVSSDVDDKEVKESA